VVQVATLKTTGSLWGFFIFILKILILKELQGYLKIKKLKMR
jgi:hypothetical protein